GEPLQIDLRGRMRAMCLSLVDAAGEEIDEYGFVYVAGTPRACADGVGLEALPVGRCVLIGTGEPVSLIYEGPKDFAIWSGPFGDATVTAQRVPESRFHIAGLPPAPDGDAWTIRAIAAAGEGRTKMLCNGDEQWRPNAWTFGSVAADAHGTLRLLP